MTDTIFHKIIRREIQANIVFEDDFLIVINDINPAAECHLLIIPKKNLDKISSATEEDKLLLGHMLLTCKKLADKMNISNDGYRIVINSGENAGQTVFQLHMHLLGGRKFDWPPG